MCSDTGHWCGSHLAPGHTRPRLQKSTAAPDMVPQALVTWPWPLSSIISHQPIPLHASPAKLLGSPWDELDHVQAPVSRHSLFPLTAIPSPLAFKTQLRSTSSRKPARTPECR